MVGFGNNDMKKDLHKDPFVVAIGLTVLAFMFLPHRNYIHQFDYRFVTNAVREYLHWPTLVLEMVAIWCGFFLYKHISKPEEGA